MVQGRYAITWQASKLYRSGSPDLRMRRSDNFANGMASPHSPIGDWIPTLAPRCGLWRHIGATTTRLIITLSHGNNNRKSGTVVTCAEQKKRTRAIIGRYTGIYLTRVATKHERNRSKTSIRVWGRNKRVDCSLSQQVSLFWCRYEYW